MPPAVAPANAAPKPEEPADVFEKSIGSFGPWQAYMIFLISLSKIPIAWHTMNITIIAPPVDFTCKESNKKQCDENCTEHVFDKSVFTNTIITEWDLVCKKEYLEILAQQTTLFGILVGSILIGFWADRSGRRMPIVICEIIQSISGLSCAFIPWFWAFIVMRFIGAAASGALMIVTFVLLMELLGTKWRCVVSGIYNVPGALGFLLLAPISYYLRNWRDSQIATGAPNFIFILYYWLLPESPRWLITVGKEDQAIRILEKAAKYNRRPTDTIATDVQAYAELKKTEKKGKASCLDLFNTTTMAVRTLLIGFNWTVVGFCYYAISHLCGHLAGNIFLNITLAAIVKIPGSLMSILFLLYVGRKPSMVVAYGFASASMFVLVLVHIKKWGGLWGGIGEAIPAVAGLCGMSMSFSIVYIYGGELFPTVIRNIGVGIISTMSRLPTLAAPVMSTLESQGHAPGWVTPLVMALLPFIGIILLIWLPETRNTKLPDSIEDALNLGKKEPKEAQPAAAT